MADLTMTPANVVPQAGANIQRATAGEAIDAGEIIYLDSTDNNEAKLADTSTQAKAAAVGIAVNSAAEGQPVDYVSSGNVALGSILTASVGYAVADTAGGLRPFADNGTGDWITQIGIAKSATILTVNIVQTGAQK